MKVAILAGGVGGAKLVHGLVLALEGNNVSAIVNTGDDFVHLGLKISPDLDTVMYTLAGLANPVTGWGLAGETFACLEALERLGGPAWFGLGDRDLATHLRRTALLGNGFRLTEVTAALCRSLGAQGSLLPMTDDQVATKVVTEAGELDFQEYFVHRRCEPVVTSFRFAGIQAARPTHDVLEALRQADAVVFGPSNPFVSIDPILALPGMREAIAAKPAVAVSPIVGGAAIKGPAAKMLTELGLAVTPAAVAAHYRGMIGGFVLDKVDAEFEDEIRDLGLRTLVAQTVMRSDDDRLSLAFETLRLAAEVGSRQAV